MKIKLLKDIDCMSGTGWMPEDGDCFECPNCFQEIEIYNKVKIKCHQCGKQLKIEKGIQHMIRIVETDTSEEK
jgi:Zn finger protein HypA/HybF involved in hydrogenase expression